MDKNEITESLFDAINIIARQAVNEIAYDTTKECEIIDISDAADGWYMVTDGAIKFKAYSEVKYKLEDKVRISIPNGDFTQTKYIIGKSVKENDIIQPITYVSELDSVLSLEEDLSINNNEYGLTANDGDTSGRLIWEIDLTRQTDSIARSSICDTFYIQADFRCLLNSYKIKSGSYGLRVEFYVPVGESGNYVIKTAYMDSKDMFGNPYAFTIFSTQEKKFKLGQIGAKVDGIKIYFYQSNDFTYKKNGSITILEPSQFNNIFVRNIITGFGSEIANVEDNTLQIYTKQSLYYNESAANNQKDLAIAWYNKNSSNEYLGFSDGKYDKDYDEIEYLIKSAEISRLTSRRSENVPDDYAGLSLAADIEELNNKIGNIGKVIKYDLVNLLTTYQTRLNDVITDDEIIADKLKDNIELFKESGQTITDNMNNLKEQYYKWLRNAVKQLNGEELDEDFNTEEEVDTDSMEEANKAGALESIQQLIDSSLTLVNYNLDYFTDTTQLLTYIAEKYPAYLGICKNYKIKIENIQEQLKVASDLFNKLIYNNEDNKANGTNIDQLLAYFEENYVFEKIDDFLKEQEDLSQYDNKYCLYWYHYNPEIVNEEEYNFMDEGWIRLKDKNNFGLPAQGEDGYYVKDDDSVFKALSIDLDLMKSEEKYALVLFYNHEQIKSNILTFTNNTEIVTDEDIALQGEVNIINGDKSLDHYPFYGIDNLLTPSERTYERQLKLEYKGTYYTADKVLPGALVRWYIPEYSSMILPVSDTRLKELNFVTIESDEPGYICYQKTIDFEENDKKEIEIDEEDLNFYYKIDINYSPNVNRNMIICKISQGDMLLQAEKIFTFGNEGVSGTDYDLRIRPVNLQTIAGSENYKLELDISLFNGTKEIPIYTKTSGLEEGEYAYNVKLNIKPSDENFIYEQLIESNEKETLTGCKITYNNTNKYCGILEVQMDIGSVSGEGADANHRVITLTQYYPITFSPQLNENNLTMASEGASAIVYDNLGSNPSFVSKPYKLFNSKGEEYDNIKWQMMYYQYDSRINKYVKITTEKTIEDEFNKFNKKYMPTLSDKNILIPSKLYIENIDCYATVEAIDENNKLLFVQNIIIMQNRYPSTFINQWDGSFEIDEKNGTIMGTMFGAGRKNSDNQFEGVLMGDVAAGASFDYDNKTGIGIYGFNKGAQSFAFLNDGTGFIGKSGAGRILFDGNNSIIASANWFNEGIINSDGTIQEGSAKDGMAIDLKSGHIDAFNFKLTSNNIVIDSNQIINGEKSGIGYFALTNSINKDKFIQLTTKADTNPLQIGNNLIAGWDGTLKLYSLQAEGGYIGAWDIYQEYGKNYEVHPEYYTRHASEVTMTEENRKFGWEESARGFDGLFAYSGYNNAISNSIYYTIKSSDKIDDTPLENGKSYRVQLSGAENIAILPNRDNVITIGVPPEQWLVEVNSETKSDYVKNDSDQSQNLNLKWDKNSKKWVQGFTFNTGRLRILNSGEIYTTGLHITDVIPEKDDDGNIEYVTITHNDGTKEVRVKVGEKYDNVSTSITGNHINTGSISSGDITSSGNITTSGNINSSGNILGNVIMENGSIHIDGMEPGEKDTNGEIYEGINYITQIFEVDYKTACMSSNHLCFYDFDNNSLMSIEPTFDENDKINGTISYIGGWRLGPTGLWTQDDKHTSIGLRSSANVETGSLFYIKPERFRIKEDDVEPENCINLTDYIHSLSAQEEVKGAKYLYFYNEENEQNELLNVGSESRPVYFKDGVPIPCSSLALDLPEEGSYYDNANLLVKSFTIDENGKETGWGLYESNVSLSAIDETINLVKTNEETINSLMELIDKQGKSIVAIDERVGVNEIEIYNIKGDNLDPNTNLSTLQENINTLQNEVEKIQKLENDDTTLKNTIIELQNAISNLQEQIDSLKGEEGESL